MNSLNGESVKHNNNYHVARGRAGCRKETRSCLRQAVRFDWPKRKAYKALPDVFGNGCSLPFGKRHKFKMLCSISLEQ